MNVKQLGKRNIVRKERWFLMRCNTFHRRMLIQRVIRRGLNHLRKKHNGKNDSDKRVTSGVCRTTGVIVPPLQRGITDKYAYFQYFIFLSPTYLNDTMLVFILVVQANDQQMSQVMEQETLICPMMMSPLRVKKSRSIVQRYVLMYLYFK